MHDMSLMCKIVQRAIKTGVYIPRIAETIIQAQYYKVTSTPFRSPDRSLLPVQDPFQIEEYLKHSLFLKDINNDGDEKNTKYRENLMTLEAFVMVKFRDDDMGKALFTEAFIYRVLSVSHSTRIGLVLFLQWLSSAVPQRTGNLSRGLDRSEDVGCERTAVLCGMPHPSYGVLAEVVA